MSLNHNELAAYLKPASAAKNGRSRSSSSTKEKTPTPEEKMSQKDQPEKDESATPAEDPDSMQNKVEGGQSPNGAENETVENNESEQSVSADGTGCSKSPEAGGENKDSNSGSEADGVKHNTRLDVISPAAAEAQTEEESTKRDENETPGCGNNDDKGNNPSSLLTTITPGENEDVSRRDKTSAVATERAEEIHSESPDHGSKIDNNDKGNYSVSPDEKQMPNETQVGEVKDAKRRGATSPATAKVQTDTVSAGRDDNEAPDSADKANTDDNGNDSSSSSHGRKAYRQSAGGDDSRQLGNNKSINSDETEGDQAGNSGNVNNSILDSSTENIENSKNKQSQIAKAEHTKKNSGSVERPNNQDENDKNDTRQTTDSNAEKSRGSTDNMENSTDRDNKSEILREVNGDRRTSSETLQKSQADDQKTAKGARVRQQENQVSTAGDKKPTTNNNSQKMCPSRDEDAEQMKANNGVEDQTSCSSTDKNYQARTALYRDKKSTSFYIRDSPDDKSENELSSKRQSTTSNRRPKTTGAVRRDDGQKRRAISTQPNGVRDRRRPKTGAWATSSTSSVNHRTPPSRLQTAKTNKNQHFERRMQNIYSSAAADAELYTYIQPMSETHRQHTTLGSYQRKQTQPTEQELDQERTRYKRYGLERDIANDDEDNNDDSTVQRSTKNGSKAPSTSSSCDVGNDTRYRDRGQASRKDSVDADDRRIFRDSKSLSGQRPPANYRNLIQEQVFHSNY